MPERNEDLGAIDAAFAGFKLIRGELVDPAGYSYPPGVILAIPLRRQQLAHYERELGRPRQLLL